MNRQIREEYKVEKYPNGKFTQAIRKKRTVKKPLEAAKKF